MIAIIVVVGGAIALRLMTVPVTPHPSSPTQFPNSLDSGQSGQPTSLLGSLFGTVAPTPTPTPATAKDLSNELKTTVDDGGAADLNSLSREANGL